MNSLIIPIYHLYLLQLENYELLRYFRLLTQKGYVYSKTPLRKSIVWTAKAKLMFFLSCLMYVAGTLFLYTNVSILSALLFFVIGFFLFPFLYSIVLLLLFPVDAFFKFFIITRACRELTHMKGVTVIAIAGSYGKTTMKNVLSSVLSTKFVVASTPESVNTPVGISRWLTQTLTDKTQILIIELGEHYRGDIKGLSAIVRPDIAILTGINEAHLERLKNLETSTDTMFEIVENAKPDMKVVLNADDEILRTSYKKYTQGKQVLLYSAKSEKKVFDEKTCEWTCKLETVGTVEIPLLGEYGIGDVHASVLIGKLLGMNERELKNGIAEIKPVTHRLELMKGAGGAIVIDDSYNGNPDGVKEAIRVLSRFVKRRKIFITPGLVETGSRASIVHETIGRELAPVADLVILIKNSVTPYIEKGLRAKKFDETHIIWFNTASDAHEALSGIVTENDVILFQNDWGDQYI